MTQVIRGESPHYQSPKGETHISFFHGLGDCSNFAHAVGFWTKLGETVGIHCSPDKECLFKAAGAKIVKHGFPHRYPHPANNDHWINDRDHNKLYFNLNLAHLDHPDITDEEVWDCLCEVKLSLSPFLTHKDQYQVDGFLSTVKTPLILLHARGNTNPHSKDLPPHMEKQLYTALVKETDSTIMLLDWKPMEEPPKDSRFRQLSKELPNISLPQLAYLYSKAQLFIGVDSGPLHFTRFTDVKALGLWWHHFPSHFALPRKNTYHLVSNEHWREPEKVATRAKAWNLIHKPLYPNEIANYAKKILTLD